MNVLEKKQKMVANYAEKRDRSGEKTVMEFHRKHLVIFMSRFRLLASHYGTPSSILLSNDIFLAVEAATLLAREDLEKQRGTDRELETKFERYFEYFDRIQSGLIALDEGAMNCVAALSRP